MISCNNKTRPHGGRSYSIATSQSNLALVLQDLGELEEARDLSKKAYESYLNKFGSHHQNTKIVKKNLESIQTIMKDF